MKSKSGKAKVEKYLGPNKVVAGGKIIRLAVNHSHPAVGDEVEFAEDQIVIEAKAEPKHEVKPHKTDK